MIKIICVGKVKELFYREAIEEYVKRLNKYIKIKIIEVPDVSYDIQKTKKEEYKNIMKYYDPSDYNILLDIGGIQLDSIAFAKKIDNIISSNHDITFIIGGSYGIYDELKQKCNYLLSFSKMTFPHQLFRVILLEQIYRSFKINNNEEYHK